MKLTLSNVKELKRASTNPLTKHVCNYVIDRWGDYDNKRYTATDAGFPTSSKFDSMGETCMVSPTFYASPRKTQTLISGSFYRVL